MGPDGIITTIAGTGPIGWSGGGGYSGDGGPAIEAKLKEPLDVALGPDGSVYVLDFGNNRIRRIAPDGIITTVAGNGEYDCDGDGGFAWQARFIRLGGITIDRNNVLYIADEMCRRIRMVDTRGTITTIAGNGETGFEKEDGGLALAMPMMNPGPLAVGSDGGLLYRDAPGLRRIASPLPGFSPADVLISAQDGTEVYVFNGVGRHLETRDTLTGTLRYQFVYDSKGRLISVTDKDGQVTVIERDLDGNPTAILAPHGQRTTLTLNSHGYLASITNPAGETTQFGYTEDGLLTTLTDPRSLVHAFTYDNLGLLLRDEDPAGGSQTLGRTDVASGFQVAHTTAENRVTTYRVENLPTGEKRRTDLFADGTQSVALQRKDGSIVVTLPDGTVVTRVSGPDPRFGMQSPLPKSVTFATPGGLAANVTMNRTVSLTDPNNPLSLATLTATVGMNGPNHTSTFDAASLTFTDTTPMGRQSTTKIDSLGRVIEHQVPGLFSTRYSYDAQGRLSAVATGSGLDERTTSFHYNPDGYVDTITDPLSQVLGLEYDASGRLIKEVLPDGRHIVSTFDENGNVKSVTPPGQPAHFFEYNSLDLLTKYVPPDVEAGADETQFSFNKDGDLTQILHPDGQTIDLGYDSGGRLSSVGVSRGAITYDFSPATGQLKTITAPGGIILDYTYDGSLLTRRTLGGPVAGSVSAEYDGTFRIIGLKINHGDPIPLQYDHDNLLTQAGPLALTYNGQNGLLTGTGLGNVSDTWTYSGFGEPTDYSATYNTAQQFTYDKSGRIIQKDETITGATDTYEYAYDPAGRLIQVQKNGVISSTYTYDGNNNRLTGPHAATSYTYDAQDRLLTQSTALGTKSYTYSANGELQSKALGDETTVYQYDALGNLMNVATPDGTGIEYLVDGLGRRIGKKVNGNLVQGFLYLDGLKPLAELDGGNNVVSVFVYGSRYITPDYMVKGGVTYRILVDLVGSPRLVVNTATGDIVQRMDYDEFGNVLQDTHPGFQPFGFAGGLYDPQTGLVRFGARDYDAEVGRWTAKDPLLFGTWGATNTYEYVLSDPVNFVDPEGMQLLPRFRMGPQQPRLSPQAEKLLNWQNEIAKPMMQKQFSMSPGGKGVEIVIKALSDAALTCMGGLPQSPWRSLLGGTPRWQYQRYKMMEEIAKEAQAAARNLPAPASLPRGAPPLLPNLPAPASIPTSLPPPRVIFGP